MAAQNAVAEELDPASLLPPKPPVIVGARLRSLLDSEMVRSAAAQPLPPGMDFAKLASSLGFDPLRDIDEILFAANGSGKEAPSLLIARGRFDRARLPAKGEVYRGVRFLRLGSSPASAMALLDPSTMLAGDAAEIRAAIDRRDSGPALDQTMASRVTAMRRRFDCWGFGEQTAGLAPKGRVPTGLEAVDRFEFGIQWTRGLEITAELHMPEAGEARELSTWLRSMEKMFRGQQPSLGQARFDIGMTGGTLKIALAISEEQLKKAIKTQVANATSVSPAPPPQRSRPGWREERGEPRPLTISAPVAPPKAGESPVVVKLPGGR